MSASDLVDVLRVEQPALLEHEHPAVLGRRVPGDHRAAGAEPITQTS